MAHICARCGSPVDDSEKSTMCSRCSATHDPAQTMPFSQANVPTVESTRSSGGSLSENKKYAIVILNGEDPGRVVPIEKPRVVIGRSDCDIVINDAELSRQHALVAINGTSARLEDLGSTNGTYVDEKPIESHELTDKSEFRIGHRTRALVRDARSRKLGESHD